MLITSGLRDNAMHKKFVIGPHPIIQRFLETLRIEQTIGSFMKQDARKTLSVEKTLCVLIHNILGYFRISQT